MKFLKTQGALFSKMAMIGFLMLLLQIPLSMVDGAARERQSYGYQATTEIAASWGGQQSIVGPLLVVPYSEVVEVAFWDENLKQYQQKKQTRLHQLILMPENLKVQGEIDIEKRSRGIFSMPVYTTDLTFNGKFDFASLKELVAQHPQVTIGQPSVVILNSDNRAYRQIPALTWNDAELGFRSGHPLKYAGNGVSAEVPLASLTDTVSYAFTLAMRGSGGLYFSPVGKNTEVELAGQWPHPAFLGSYLPDSHDIGKDGFNAQWHTTSFASDLNRAVEKCGDGSCAELVQDTFGVELAEPVSIYSLTERSVKYAVLFILLTFSGFFLFEITQRLRIHPMQYMLVGFAISAFFMVLLALSEHLDFDVSYWLAAGACVCLIVGYMRQVMGAFKYTLSLGGGLVVIYGYLFSTLQSEDYALLMGSLLVFGALAVVMLATRHIDWYQVNLVGMNQEVDDAK